ncbi:MAG: hypothetical protein RIR26_2759 [Pseudomonadota bacterium]
MEIQSKPDSAGKHLNIRLIIAVPARLGSTRLPRKPLATLAGRPLIAHVAHRVAQCAREICKTLSISEKELLCLVATDSTEIADCLKESGLQICMTPSDLPSGTDRIEAAVMSLEQTGQNFPDDCVVINLQGDEPFFCVEDIVQLAKHMFSDGTVPMATLAFPQNKPEQFLRASVVKVVRNAAGNALYFSRAPIAWPRALWGASDALTALGEKLQADAAIPFLQHVGIYAFRRNFLQAFTKMPPSTLETTEGLEQLRALEAGWNIRVVTAREAPFGIDTMDDLLRAEHHLKTTERRRE